LKKRLGQLKIIWKEGVTNKVLSRKVGEGSGHRLRSPAVPEQNPGRGPRGQTPKPPGFCVFRKLFRHQFWSISWMWWSVLKRMNLLQKVSNSF
jgi:hypothetical protein